MNWSRIISEFKYAVHGGGIVFGIIIIVGQVWFHYVVILAKGDTLLNESQTLDTLSICWKHNNDQGTGIIIHICITKCI